MFPIYRTSAFNLLTCMSGHFPLSVPQPWPPKIYPYAFLLFWAVVPVLTCSLLSDSALHFPCRCYLLFSDCPFLVIILHWYIWLNVIWLDKFDNSNLSYIIAPNNTGYSEWRCFKKINRLHTTIIINENYQENEIKQNPNKVTFPSITF